MREWRGGAHGALFVAEAVAERGLVELVRKVGHDGVLLLLRDGVCHLQHEWPALHWLRAKQSQRWFGSQSTVGRLQSCGVLALQRWGTQAPGRKRMWRTSDG